VNEIAPRVHTFLATLTAAPTATARVSALWEEYRRGLPARERRAVRRKHFLDALRSAGAIAIGHHGEQLLLGYSTDPAPTLIVDPITRKVCRT